MTVLCPAERGKKTLHSNRVVGSRACPLGSDSGRSPFRNFIFIRIEECMALCNTVCEREKPNGFAVRSKEA